jgi:hypothetical protein
LPGKLTSKQWEEIGRGLGKIEQATQWWIGDWWAYGDEAGSRRETDAEFDMMIFMLRSATSDSSADLPPLKPNLE